MWENLLRYKHDVYQAVAFLPSGVKFQGKESWDIKALDLRWNDTGHQIFSVEMLLKTAPTNITTFQRLVNPLFINYGKHTLLLLTINERKVLCHSTLIILIYKHRNLEKRWILRNNTRNISFDRLKNSYCYFSYFMKYLIYKVLEVYNFYSSSTRMIVYPTVAGYIGEFLSLCMSSDDG